MRPAAESHPSSTSTVRRLTLQARLVQPRLYVRAAARSTDRRRRRAARLGAAAAVAAVLAVSVLAPPAAARTRPGERLVFRPPVDAPVADPFRPPDNPYGPGNRGIEYRTDPGDAVRAAAAGTVSFAGTVAGSLYVTVDHGGGLISSYSYLGRIGVRDGRRVDRGDPVGTTGARAFHFSVRIDGTYVDPARFIGIRRVRVRLVPHWTRWPR